MKCPVCKTELHEGATICPNCKFDDLQYEFLNADDALKYRQAVVSLYRNKRVQITNLALTLQLVFNYKCGIIHPSVNGTERETSVAALCDKLLSSQKDTIHVYEVKQKETFEYTSFCETGMATITKYNGEEKTVVVPDQLGGYPVGRIGDSVFEKCKSINYIQLPKTLISIGKNAFKNSALKEIIIPESCSIIKEGAFSGTGISEIVFPEVVKHIGHTVCDGCHSLGTVVLLGAEEIHTCAFAYITHTDNRALSIYLGNTLKVLELSAFNGTYIDELILPASLEKIWTAPYHSVSLKINKMVFLSDTVNICDNGRQAILNIGEIVCNIGSSAYNFAIKKNISVTPLSKYMQNYK